MPAAIARLATRLFLLLYAALAAGHAWAGTLTIDGTLQPAAPKMPVVVISPPLCGAQRAEQVTYRAHPLAVSALGNYTLTLTSATGFASFYLYEGDFDPAHGSARCMRADNEAPKQMTYDMVPGTRYVLVVIDDSRAQDAGAYAVTVSGPGNIVMPDPVPVPALSSWATALLAAVLALAAGRRR